MIYLLRDPDYFDLDEEKQGRVSSNILSGALAAGMLYSPVAGWVYDRFNRKLPISLAIILAAGSLALFPLTSPNLVALSFVRIFLEVCMT